MYFSRNKSLSYIITVVVGIVACCNFAFSANSDFIQSQIDAKNIEVIVSSKRDTDYPIRAKPDPSYAQTELSYRVQDVLPASYTQDKNADAYIVYPEQGIVFPVL